MKLAFAYTLIENPEIETQSESILQWFFGYDFVARIRGLHCTLSQFEYTRD